MLGVCMNDENYLGTTMICATRELELRSPSGRTATVTLNVRLPTPVLDYWSCDYELFLADEPLILAAVPATDTFEAIYMAMLLVAKAALALRSQGELRWNGRAEFLGLEDLARELSSED